MIKRWLVILSLAALVLPNVPSTFAAPAPDYAGQALFIENVGQFHPEVRYLAHLDSGPLYVTTDGLWLAVLSPSEKSSDPLNQPDRGDPPPLPSAGAWVKVSFSGSNLHTRLEPAAPGNIPYSYFFGNDPENWHAAVPVWSQLNLVDLYPGLTLELSAPNGQLRLQAQADSLQALQALAYRVEGALDVKLDASPAETSQALHFITTAGTLKFPLVETVSQQANQPTLRGEAFGFTLSAPYTGLVSQAESATRGVKKWHEYSTFLGGSHGWGEEGGLAVAANKWGAAYVTGNTVSYDFPTTPGAFDPSSNGDWDAFVVRIDPSGERLLYATFLGGWYYDWGVDLVLDAQGGVYLTGNTSSDDFPITADAYNPLYSGSQDSFVTRLAPSGAALLYSTFVGGSNTEFTMALNVDAQGLMYISGISFSDDFPLTANALDTVMQNGDAFLTVLQPNGQDLVYSSFLGGDKGDNGIDIYAASLGRVVVGGLSSSKNFPYTPYAFDRKVSSTEGFVAVFDLTQPKLVYATMLGGKHADVVTAVAADKDGYVYAAGETMSPDFPTTPGAYKSYLGGGSDAFLVKLAPDGRRAVYSTQLGGSGWDWKTSLVVDRKGAAYLTGLTNSPDFPITPGPLEPGRGVVQDVFVVKFARDGSGPSYSTVFGGSTYDVPSSLSLSANGALFITGMTESQDFPVTPGVLGPTFNGRQDVFVTRLWVQDHPPKDPALMTAAELYLEEEVDLFTYRVYMPILP